MSLRDKRGIIKVSDSIMWDFKVMKIIYSEFFPFHIEYEHWNKTFKIYGCCERFIEIKEGDPVPQYDFIIQHDFEMDKMYIKECEKI